MSLSRQGVMTALSRHVSQNTAHGILRWINREYRLDPDRMNDSEIPKFVEALEIGSKPFLSDAGRSELRTQLLGAGAARQVVPQVFAVNTEADVSRARLGARVLCQAAGATSVTCMQVATGVSELARNIVQYAGSGEIEISFRTSSDRAVIVRSTDRGPGIPNLDLVLSGQYQSKTGMGRGLMGIKRMTNRCDIKTGPEGTRIEFEVRL